VSVPVAEPDLITFQHCPQIAVVKIPFNNSCIHVMIWITTKL